MPFCGIDRKCHVLGFDPVPAFLGCVTRAAFLHSVTCFPPTCRADRHPPPLLPTARDGAQGFTHDELSAAKPCTQLLKFQWESTTFRKMPLTH